MNLPKKWINVYVLFCGAFLCGVVWLNRAATTMSQSVPVCTKNCIVIDAGHGGVDGGAISCTGKPESALNLQIALQLNDLMHLLGYNTKMIRTSDISVYTEEGSIAKKKISDLKERVRIVSEVDNALLISIHQNHFSESQYRGAQVFYADTPGSKELASILQKNLIAAVNPESKRTIKRSEGIYLMEHVSCTAVLIECGFLSNPEEEALLRSKAYQQKLCCSIAATVTGFLSNT